MGTIVTIEIVASAAGEPERAHGIDRAFGWFAEVEKRCSRFDASSESRQLAAQPGVAIAVSDLLFATVEFAVTLARETNGAFDPAVGARMESQGFNRNYRTGLSTDSNLNASASATFEDVVLDPVHKTITLARPLLLDLGAVAKGLAIDLAALELRPFGNFAIDAGGDLYLGGCNSGGEPWSVGIRHPTRDREAIEAVRVSDAAVCTSGTYERGAHILDPRTGSPADLLSSATVIAPNAMLADALATAAFVLGPEHGLQLLLRHGVEGVLWTAALDRVATPGYEALLSHA